MKDYCETDPGIVGLCNNSSPPTQLKDLQGHGEARLLGSHQRPVAGAEVLTGGQQQQHGQLVSKLHQLPGVHTILICLLGTPSYIRYNYRNIS